MTSPSSAVSSSEHSSSGVASSGEPVAVTRPEIVAAGSRRIVALVATASFLLMIFGHALVDLFAPVPAPTLIGAEKQARDSRRANARFADGTLAKLAEENLRLTSRVRRVALAVYSPMLLRWFHMAGADKVVGANGTFFLRDRIAVADAPRDEVIGRVVGRLKALSRYLERLGAHVVAVPLPRKEVVDLALLPAGIDPHPEYDRELIAGLLAAGVDAVDLLPEFDAMTEERAYSPADSHWSTSGEVVAARAVARRLQPDRPLREPQLIDASSDDSAFVAYTLGLDPIATTFLPSRQLLVRYIADPATVRCSIDAPSTGEVPLLLAGTSFSMRADYTPMLFVAALSVMLDRPIWNAARPGSSAMSTLADALRSIRGRPLPAHIVLELPNHQLLGHPSPMWDMSAVFAEVPVLAGLQSLQRQPADRFSIPAFLPGSAILPGHLAVPKGPRLVSRILENTFIYPRDGTLMVVLRGKVAGEIEVYADRGNDGVYMRWRAGREDFVVPVAGDRIGTTLDVVVGAPDADATLDLESIDVVCDLDVAGGIAGVAVAPPTEHAGGWQQVFEFTTGTAVADACVGLVLDGGNAAPAPLTVEVRFADGTSERLFGPRRVASKASVLLPLGPRLRELRGVTVAGEGRASGRLVRAFHLRRLPR